MNPRWDDIVAAANSMGVEPCALSAVVQVESNGNGFLPNGKPKILFEPHVFWKELVKINYSPSQLLLREDVKAIHGDINDILYKKWKPRSYGAGGENQWNRLDRAAKINEEAALCSASWGLFQIMGFNHKLCGYVSVYDMVRDMSAGYVGQFRALHQFLTGAQLLNKLKTKNWKAFARGYNGPSFEQHGYDLKLHTAYSQCKETRK